MGMSAFQKVTLATCFVLCVALLLPKMLLSRGRKDAAERPEGSTFFPPKIHPQKASESRIPGGAASGFSRAHAPEALTKSKGAGTGAGTGGKSNLAGQIIPVYGFGILLYILYILFKITSKGNNRPPESRFPPVRSENMKRKITDFQLAQLQEKLRETELVMENIVSSAHHSPDRVTGVTPDQEESLLKQLTEITRVMQEGQLAESFAQEKIQKDWDDYPEACDRYWEHSRCCCQHGSEAKAAEGEEDVSENIVTEEVRGEGAEVRAEKMNPDAKKEHVETELTDQDGPQRMKERRQEQEQREEDDPLAPEEKLGLILKMVDTGERRNEEDLHQAGETEVSSSSVRRRNKRRRSKKSVH